MGVTVLGIQHNFYPRSPCGERRNVYPDIHPPCAISIHALLAESDLDNIEITQAKRISIHALLAESDRGKVTGGYDRNDFYPRSPCGERLPQKSYLLPS